MIEARSAPGASSHSTTCTAALVLCLVALLLCPVHLLADVQSASPDRGPTAACGAGELLTANGFEELPDYAINFVSDANTVFTAPGQDFTFTIEFVDGNGTPLDAGDIEWCLEDESLLTVGPSGLSATVTSTGFALGSVDLIVRDRRSLIENTATIAFADLAPDTVYLDSGWVDLAAPRGGNLTLARNPATELIQVGDVLVSGDVAGVLERVLTVNLTATQVTLTTEPAVITEAFDELDVSASSPALRGTIRYTEPGGQLEVVTQGVNGMPQRDSFTLGDIECTTSTGATYPLQVSGGSLDWSIDSDLDATLRISAGTLTEFTFTNSATVTLGASTGTMTLGSELSGEVTCELPLPAFDTPSVPVSVFSFGLSAQPNLGLQLEGSITTPSFSLSGPEGRLISGVTSGIRYTNVGGWEPVIDSQFEPSISGFAADFDTEFTFALAASAFGGLGFDFVASLGRGIISIELARVQFAEIAAAITFDSQLRTPLDPMDKDYTGPEWNLAAIATGVWKAELSGGLLSTLLDRLDISLSVEIDDPNIFEPIVLPLANSPMLGNVLLDCMPVSCNLNVGVGDGLDILVMTDGERSGQVDYLASIDGASTLIPLTSAELMFSNSLGEWAPSPVTLSGDYRVFLRVESDALSSILPYVLPTTAQERFTVGPIAMLSVEKSETGTGTPITGGRVISNSIGIDCGEICDYTYTAGSLVVLTASDGGGWEFVRWAVDSDLCPGSIDPECPFTLSADQVARAEFDPLDCTSRLEFGTLWYVSCTNDAGDLVLEELTPAVDNDGTPDGQLYTNLRIETYFPGTPFISEVAVYGGPRVYNDPQAPIVLTRQPLLRQNEDLAFISDGTIQSLGYYLMTEFPPYAQISSNEIITTEWIDQFNYTTTRIVCNFDTEFYARDITVVVNGSVDQSSSVLVSPGLCPTEAQGDALNEIGLDGSIIYQCIQMGLTYDNCPLAPLL